MSQGSPETNTARPALSSRARVALAAGRAAKRLSRALGKGEGGVIGGGVALTLHRRALEDLACGREIALVSATNGKSTTTQFLAAALATAGPAAHNHGGSNMANGLVAALDAARDAPRAALEVDEAYLGPIATAVQPRTITLMNLSHELTRGVSYKKEARHWRDTIARLGPGFTIIANADDPLVAWTVQPATDVVWVAGGLLWKEDSLVCRGCLLPIRWEGESYRCDGCGLSRAEPSWRLEGGMIHGPAGSVAVDTRLPGRANRANALFAVATAALYGVELTTAMAAIAGITDVAGRYREHDVDGRIIRLHMTKNSASWNEVVRLLASDPDAGLVFALEDFGITGRDTATIWDSPVELLAGRRAVTSGARRHDVARRLEVAGARVTAVADHFDAIRACPPGPVHVVANYRTFGILKKLLPS